MFTLERDEEVFKSALQAAADMARNGADKRDVVEAAEAVVAAAKAAQKKLDEDDA